MDECITRQGSTQAGGSVALDDTPLPRRHPSVVADRRNWVTIVRLAQPDYRDSEALAALGAELEKVARGPNPPPVVLNCAAGQAFGSTFVAKLLMLRRVLMAQASQLVLCNLSDALASLLERLRLGSYFRVCRDEHEALALLD
jgi:anti-anti-sigma regulatory factor